MLKTKTLNYLREEAKKAGIAKMMLFGSCLHKAEDEARDIDLAVQGIEGWNFHLFHGNLMTDLGKSIDMVNLSDNTSIVPIILDEGVVIYEKQAVH